MINFFKSNQPFAILLYVVIGVLFASGYYFFDKEISSYTFGIWGSISGSYSFWVVLLSLPILLLNAFMLNRLFNKHEFYEKTNYLTGFVFLLLTFSFPIFESPQIIIAQSFIIWSVFQLMEIKQNEDARRNVFNGSFLLGVAITFYPTLLPLCLLPLVTLFIIRPFVIREHLLFIIGLITPFFYAFARLHLTKQTNAFFETRWDQFHIDFNFQWSEFVFLILNLCFTVVCFFLIQRKASFSSVRFKRLVNVVWGFYFLTFLADILTRFQFDKMILNLAIPLSLVMSMGALFLKRTRFFEFVFFILSLTVIWMNLIHLF